MVLARFSLLTLAMGAFLFTSGAPAFAEQLDLTSSSARQTKALDWTLYRFYNLKRISRLRLRGEYVTSMDTVRQKYIELFDQHDYDFDGISAADRKKKQSEMNARPYSTWMSKFHIKDKNRDMEITRDELRTHFFARASAALRTGQIYVSKTRQQIERTLDQLIKHEMLQDTNRDGKITLQEYAKGFKMPFRSLSFRNQISQRIIPKHFDQDRDGLITKVEYLAIVDQILSALDRDQNGYLSKQEDQDYIKLYRSMRQQRFQRQREQRRNLYLKRRQEKPEGT